MSINYDSLASSFTGVAGVVIAILVLVWALCCLLAPYYIYKTYLEARRSRIALERLVSLNRRQ